MPEAKVRLGRRIRNLRRLRDLTQEELAEKASLSGKYLGEIERGVANATIDTIENLAEALEVELPDLFEISHEDDRRRILKEISNLLDKADDNSVKLVFRVIKALLQ